MNTVYDVAVIGGGLAGVCAAVAAAQSGAKTILFEYTYSLGGIATDGPLEALMTFHDGENSKVIGGIAQKIVERMKELAGSPGFVGDTTGYCKTIVPYDPEILKFVLYEFLMENNVKVHLGSIVEKIEIEDNMITAVTVRDNHKSSRYEIGCGVDASGDAVGAFLCGEVLAVGNEKNQVQPMSILCALENVDVTELLSYVQAHKDEFKFADDTDFSSDNVHLWGFGKELHQGVVQNILSLERNEIQMMCDKVHSRVIVNFSRVRGDPLAIENFAEYQFVALKQLHELFRFLKKNIPGFTNASIARTGKIGIRESRRPVGKYVLTKDDILNGTNFPDSVAHGAFPIDIHQAEGNSLTCYPVVKAYSIPARSLQAKNTINLFYAGRCISASSEALASVRITATAMATGQAAGVMAGIFAKQKKCEISYVHNELEKQYAVY